MNSPKRITQLNGTELRAQVGSATARPSTALKTEMAGVMTPSPNKSAAPATAKNATNEIRPGRATRRCSGTSASKAKMPPSPLLSAFMMKIRYFTVTTSVNAQNNSDRTPNKSDSDG